MRLTFAGAADTVTGSRYVLDTGQRHILVDCGLFQGFKKLRERNWARFPVAPQTIERVVLTHAHLDHSGYLPALVRDGFRGEIVATAATRELCEILLRDSARLQEEEADFANRHGYSKHAPARPLYTSEDAERALSRFRVVEFDETFPLGEGIEAQFLPAGHLLGAAMVRLQRGSRTVLFSGDLGRPDDLVMRPPRRVESAGTLIVESTYGNRKHEASDALAQLETVINKTAARGGVVVIPAFAVGRAQSLMYGIYQLKKQGRIHQHLPVYLDSPMAIDATRLYHAHRDEHRLSPEECEGMCHAAKIVNKVEESKALSAGRGPMVIISASGMATGGRVVHHLKSFAPDHRNTILFAGYQAGGTRGAAIVHGASTVRIHGQDVPIRAEVASLDNLSAHADADEILAWMRGFTQTPRRTFVTHGEPEAADALRARIDHELGWSVAVPEYLQTVDLV